MATAPARLKPRATAPAAASAAESDIDFDDDAALNRARTDLRVEKTAFMKGWLQEQRSKDPTSVQTGADIDATQICLPTPALALEHLLGVSGLPLGLIYHLSGPAGVGKTGFLVELIRWAFMEGGGGTVIENEGKINGGWYKSILGDNVWEEAINIVSTKHVEGWQDAMTTAISGYQDYIRKQGLPKVPVFFGLDSLVGKTTAKEQDNILGAELEGGGRSTKREGHAKADFARHAALNSKYLASVTSLLADYPIAIFLINHESTSKDDYGNDVHETKGGTKVKYLSSMGLRLSPLSAKPKIAVKAGYEYNDIRIEVFKNSLASKNRTCIVRLKWKHVFDPATQTYHQNTVWDWDWALSKRLCSIFTDTSTQSSLFRRYFKDLDLHFAFPSVSELGATAWSKNLGMTSASAVSWTTMGRLIRENPELRAKVSQALQVAKRPVLGVDGSFDANLAKLHKARKKASKENMAKARPVAAAKLGADDA